LLHEPLPSLGGVFEERQIPRHLIFLPDCAICGTKLSDPPRRGDVGESALQDLHLVKRELTTSGTLKKTSPEGWAQRSGKSSGCNWDLLQNQNRNPDPGPAATMPPMLEAHRVQILRHSAQEALPKATCLKLSALGALGRAGGRQSSRLTRRLALERH